MSPVHSQTGLPGNVASLLKAYPKRWLVPAAAVAVLAAFYAFAWPSTWEAGQALIIRNAAANNDQHVGKFSHADEMKTVQETILELVRSRGVLEAALEKVGPPASRRAVSAWPDIRDVDALRDRVKLVPPKGAEFGKTEIFYLKVRAGDRDRATALATALADQLETRFQQLRNTRAESMIAELARAVTVAQSDLVESTARLSQMERQIGSDLAELRILHDSTTGESALQRTAVEIRNELRQARIALKSNQELRTLLEDARQAPETLVAMPNELLDSQPALGRLKEGLVDAQLRTAQLGGRMSPKHPLAQAAKESEREIARELYAELAKAVAGVDVDLRLGSDRIAMLEHQLSEVTGKLDRLAAVRADYSNLVAENRTRAGLLERAEQQLAEARVSKATAGAASLIGRIDAASPGSDPVGPGTAVVLLAGLFGGLAIGIGTLVMTVEPEAILGRKPSEDVAVTHAEQMAPPVNGGINRRAGGAAAAVLPVAGGGLTFRQALLKISSQTAYN
jgi:uncharacterized protein involved in exopolysaccharide biosynthesis